MRDSDVDAILVKADGKRVGIVADRDITCQGLADDGDLATMTANDVMTKYVLCCSPDDGNRIALQKPMETKQTRRLRVTDGPKAMIDILSLGDISHRSVKCFQMKCCGRSRTIISGPAARLDRWRRALVIGSEKWLS